MPIDTRLTDLLVRWEELRERGQSPTPEELCRDCPELLDPLRAQLWRLGQLDPLLETTPPLPAGPAPAEPDGSCGPYQPLKLVGGGGVGVVYLADDDELKRQVALKRMRPDLVSNQDLRRRFLREAEVTGRLEHAGIVPIYGLGADAEGKPYYAMRFIRGESLREAVARFHQADAPGRDPSERSTALRQLLTRFVAVCHAVAYAHSQGYIHRDLKPDNVMLGTYAETFVVDWGLGRSVTRAEADRPVGEETVPSSPDSTPSETRGVVGTPAYMSPEQAAGRWDLVGPASDVYSLGATLYAILTGQAPVEKGPLHEVLEKVRRGEVVPPRWRKPGVPPAVEAACLKAMAPRREDRYASASELARDVQAWLDDEPVSAWKEPFSERARRWLKRRRTMVLTSMAAAAVALVALAISTALLRVAYQAESEAKERAQRGFRMAQDTSSTLLKLAEDLKPAPGMQVRTLDDILRRASQRYDELRRAVGDSPEITEGKARVLAARSEAQVLLGNTTDALQFAQEAEKLYRGLLQDGWAEARLQAGLAGALERVGAVQPLQGRYREALAAHQEARDLRARLVQEHPARPPAQLDLAMSHHWIGNILNGEGDALGAEREYRSALMLRQRVAERDPENRDARARLARSQVSLGDMAWEHWDRNGALRHYARAVELLDDLLRHDPDNHEWRRQRTEAALVLGESLQLRGKEKEALRHFEEGLAVARRSVGLDPAHSEWRRILLRARKDVDTVRLARDPTARLRAFAAMYREMIPEAEELARLDPANLEWRMRWAGMRRSLASTLLSLAQVSGSADLLAANVVGSRSGNVLTSLAVLGCAVAPPGAVGEVLGPNQMVRQAMQREAARLLDEVEPVLLTLARQHPDRHAFMKDVQVARRLRAQLHEALGSHSAAREARQAAFRVELDYYQRRYAADPGNLSWVWRLANTCRDHSYQASDPPLSVDLSRRAVALAEELRRREPENLRWLDMLAWAHDANALAHRGVALALATDRHPTDAAAWSQTYLGSRGYAQFQASARAAFRARERLAYLRTDAPDALRELAQEYQKLAESCRARKDIPGVRAAYEKHLAALEHLYRVFPEEARRDPFNRDPDIAYEIVAPHFPERLRAARAQVGNFDRLFWNTPQPFLANELLHQLIGLVKHLDVSRPAEAAEARWALRRGLALLDELKAFGQLARPLAMLVPFFEERLSLLPSPPTEIALDDSLAGVLRRMSYAPLLRRLGDDRPRDLAMLLAADARDADAFPWAAEALRRLVLAELLAEPGRLAPLLKAARDLAADRPDPLGPAGRRLLAALALYSGDRATARALDARVEKAGTNPALLERVKKRIEEKRKARPDVSPP
jgi:serine/threonine-protein kinase